MRGRTALVATGIALIALAVLAQSRASRAPLTRHFVLVVDDVDTTTMGAKLSYIVPEGKAAIVRSWSWFSNVTTGAATARLQIARDSSVANLQSITDRVVDYDTNIHLDEGDEVRFNVTVIGVASTADAMLSVTEITP